MGWGCVIVPVVLTRFAIDEDLCIGCGLCRETAPRNFGESEVGTSRLIKQPESPAEDERCLEAAEFCPIGALTALPEAARVAARSYVAS